MLGEDDEKVGGGCVSMAKVVMVEVVASGEKG